MAVRQFYLENSLGQKCYLADKKYKQFLSEVEGLGFAADLTVVRIGDSEHITRKQIELPGVSGTILFFDTYEKAYQDYDDFVVFTRYTPLKLYYLPPNRLFPYFIEGDIVQLEKGEYLQEGYLACTFSFHGVSYWQNSQETAFVVSNIESSDGKFYDLERPYHYSGSSLNSIVVNNAGDIEIGFEFEIIGNVTNPRLTATQNGVAYGLLKLDGTFDYVKVDSNDVTQSIYLEQNDSVVANPTSYQDMSIKDGVAQLTFFKLKIGESILSFSCDKLSSFDGILRFKWKDLRKSI